MIPPSSTHPLANSQNGTNYPNKLQLKCWDTTLNTGIPRKTFLFSSCAQNEIHPFENINTSKASTSTPLPTTSVAVTSFNPTFISNSDSQEVTTTQPLATNKLITPNDQHSSSPITHTEVFSGATPYPAVSQHRFDRTKLYAHTQKNYGQKILNWSKENFSNSFAQKCFSTSATENFFRNITLQIVDVLNGHRPVRQLQGWLSYDALQAVMRRQALGLQILGGPEKCSAPQIHSMRICYPKSLVAEAAIVLFDGRKKRAAALRAETHKNRWQITAIEII